MGFNSQQKMTKNENAGLSIRCFYFAIAVCFCMLWPCYLHAQIDTAKIKQLDEVQIRAKRLSDLQNSPTPVQIIGGEELKRSNSLSVADVIRYFTGVQLKDYGGIGGLKTINVRSMGSNHSAVFYDGIQLGNAQNGQVDLGKYAVDQLEEIELYNGQRSQLLQPAKAFAAASTLYLHTAVPVFKKGEKSMLRASVKTGSFGLIDPSFTYNQLLNQNLSLTLNAELLNSNGKYKFRYTNGVYDTTAVREDADVFAQRFEGALHGKTADSSVWHLRMYNYNSERGVPGAIVSNKFRFSQRQWDDNFFIQTSYKTNPNKHFKLLINAKYAYDFIRYVDPDRVLLTGFLDNRYSQQEAYLSIANEYQVNSFWSAGISADYSYQKLDANLVQFAYPLRKTTLFALSTRLNWDRLDLQANLLATLVDEKVKNNTPASNKTEYTPTVMVSWQPINTTPNFRLRAFYKSIFRMPTFNDLYYTFIGNSLLRPEYTHQYDIGLTYSKTFANHKLKDIAIQTDVYYNEVKDKIIAVPTLNLFRWTMLNLDQVAIKGSETNFQANWQFEKILLKTKLNYTYEQALDVTKMGTAYRQQLPYIPVHSGSLTLSGSYKTFNLNYSYLYTGERYSQKANIRENYVAPWYTHDLSAGKSFHHHKIDYRIAVEVNNILNQYYDVVLNFPMPGRNYRLTLIANF